MILGQSQAGTKFHPGMTAQNPNTVWTYGPGRFVQRHIAAVPDQGPLRRADPDAHLQQHAGQPRAKTAASAATRASCIIHNAHNGAESDGAANVHHFPGTFYDYRWSTTLARRDTINTRHRAEGASGPNGNGGLVNVKGDFRELQGTLWAHDHRFFFTAENVYKGNLGMVNYYSGPDRGNEELIDGINLRLPSGRLLD